MSYSIKIGKHSIELAGYAGKVVAPNTQMAALFTAMAGALTSLGTTAQQAEAEADLLDVIRNDPDLNEQAKYRRAGETSTEASKSAKRCSCKYPCKKNHQLLERLWHSNFRCWHEADQVTELEVRCERGAEVHDC